MRNAVLHFELCNALIPNNKSPNLDLKLPKVASAANAANFQWQITLQNGRIISVDEFWKKLNNRTWSFSFRCVGLPDHGVVQFVQGFSPNTIVQVTEVRSVEVVGTALTLVDDLKENINTELVIVK